MREIADSSGLEDSHADPIIRGEHPVRRLTGRRVHRESPQRAVGPDPRARHRHARIRDVEGVEAARAANIQVPAVPAQAPDVRIERYHVMTHALDVALVREIEQADPDTLSDPCRLSVRHDRSGCATRVTDELETGCRVVGQGGRGSLLTATQRRSAFCGNLRRRVHILCHTRLGGRRRGNESRQDTDGQRRGKRTPHLTPHPLGLRDVNRDSRRPVHHVAAAPPSTKPPLTSVMAS
jgi:hypothetical protein